jgi:hypothetical protein
MAQLSASVPLAVATVTLLGQAAQVPAVVGLVAASSVLAGRLVQTLVVTLPVPSQVLQVCQVAAARLAARPEQQVRGRWAEAEAEREQASAVLLKRPGAVVAEVATRTPAALAVTQSTGPLVGAEADPVPPATRVQLAGLAGLLQRGGTARATVLLAVQATRRPVVLVVRASHEAAWAQVEAGAGQAVLQAAPAVRAAMAAYPGVEGEVAGVGSREALAEREHVVKSWLSPTSRMGG